MRTRGTSLAVGWMCGWVLAACVGTPGPNEWVANEPGSEVWPYVLVLGTAQDGGLPQIGCRGAACERARADGRHRRRVTSLLIVDPRHGTRYLLDASPDLPEQVESFRDLPASRRPPGPRPPLVDGIFLTHAHMGHYAGLLHLGREAYGARDMPVYVSQRMGNFLRENGPWNLLFGEEALRLVRIEPGVPVALSEDLSVEAIAVPHRDEFSDTLAFLVRGPGRSLLYLPDIDKWERWGTPVEEWIARVDVALLDATFFDGDEVPGRDLSQIPHPFVVESLARFADLPPEQRTKVRFTHLNHTNPLADPDGTAQRRVRQAGMAVARDGERHRLGPAGDR